MRPLDPDWTAPEQGHDWRDDTILIACAWLEALADQRTWPQRLANTQACFREARERILQGERKPLFDPADTAAWYVFQARAFAQDRRDWVPEEAVRIAPIMTRLGTELSRLLTIPGAEDVGRRLMNRDKRQPDDGLYELAVALAYRRHGWDVTFVPVRAGGSRTHDIDVNKGRRRWAVECKRMARSADHIREAERGRELADPVHRLALDAYRSIKMQVVFEADPLTLPDDTLARRAADYLADPSKRAWMDETSYGLVEDIDFKLMRRVMAKDDVYFGSSRMIELLLGQYDHRLEHSMTAKWRPSRKLPFWAATVYQASVVSWGVVAAESTMRKTKHFRRMLAKAIGQLPSDRPGVIHVGVESWAGDFADYYRHVQNFLEARSFDPGTSRLRWVYGNYFAPEMTTRHDESWAMNETMAPYRVGHHSTKQPLPHHLIISPDDNTRHGVHWDGLSQSAIV